MRRAFQLKLDTEVVYNDLGCAYARLKNYKEARAYLRQATALKPEFATAFFNLGVVNLSLQDKGAALEQYAVLKTLDRTLADKLYRMIYKAKILQVSGDGFGTNTEQRN